MPAGGDAQRWTATPVASRLLQREFEDGTVCFDPDTGETLLLSHLSNFLLGLWALAPDHPHTRHELLSQVLAVDDSSAGPAEAAALVDQALGELQRAGLIATDTCDADA